MWPRMERMMDSKSRQAVRELISRFEADRLAGRWGSKEQWGNWRLDRECEVLQYAPPNGYWIPLNQITTSAQLLDWIFQISRKSSADAVMVRDLLTALEDLFHPQASMCSSGIEQNALTPR